MKRRQFVRSAAAAAAVGICCPAVHAQGKPVLRYLSNTATESEDAIRRAEEDLGVTIEYIGKTVAGVFQAIITKPDIADVFASDAFTFKQLLQLRRTISIDTKRIPNFQSLSPALTEGRVGDVSISGQGDAPFNNLFLENEGGSSYIPSPTQWVSFVPSFHQADTLGVRPDLVDRPVQSWGDLLQPEFAGRSALVDIPSVGIIDAALAIESLGLRQYGDKGQMTREEIDFTIDFLIERKKEGHFYSAWKTFEESVDFMASGNVHLQSMWWPAVTYVRQQGIPCVYQPLREGYRGWVQGWGISKNTKDSRTRDVAYEFLNWNLSGWKGAFMQRFGFYPSALATAQEYMSENEWNYWILGKPATEEVYGPSDQVVAKAGDVVDGGGYDQRVSKIAVWNSNMNEARYLWKRWRKFSRG